MIAPAEWITHKGCLGGRMHRFGHTPLMLFAGTIASTRFGKVIGNGIRASA
jgi:hypothetical protein